MTASGTRTELRDDVDALGLRLARIAAAAGTLRALAPDARRDVSQTALRTLLAQLERDLDLATRDVRALRQRVAPLDQAP